MRAAGGKAALLIWAALAVPVPGDGRAAARDLPAPAAEIATRTDANDRMTVPVSVNGAGPFAFVIDTGADRTVVSDRLAAALALPAGRTVTMWTVTGSEPIATATLAALEIGGRSRDPFEAAVVSEATLQANGLLGVDSLAGRRVVLDFRTGRMAVAAAGSADEATVYDDPGEIVVTARGRFGQLILTQASFRGHRIDVVLDTGAEISVGNLAFLALFDRRPGALGTGLVTGVTGQSAPVRFAVLPAVRLGPITMTGATIAFADLVCFDRFGLARRPALLLGMNVLRRFDRVAIDFKRREVSFLIGKGDRASE